MERIGLRGGWGFRGGIWRRDWSGLRGVENFGDEIDGR